MKLPLSLLFLSLLLLSCANRVPEPDFRPLQLRWKIAEGEDESLMPRKDNCVILLTSRLMGESAVQGSSIDEISYDVTISRNLENSEILEFEGICRDLTIMDKPECKWHASCDQDLKTVVKFHNGD